MRLLRCSDLQFEIIHNLSSVQYAILSHRWENDEVTFQDMQGDRSLLIGRSGYQKIMSFSAKAAEHRLTHIWIDTCCIDKTNSVELSEAINSMFAWYGSAAICIAYLFDFKFVVDALLTGSNKTELEKALTKSTWFYRGWTLQELISPKIVKFYDCDWTYIDDKNSLSAIISNITTIPEDVLKGECDLQSLSIAERMSWAVDRDCERTEDVAYSLLGIFAVNMPMIYGEGPNAFRRLQEEILKNSNDHTIFLWKLSADSRTAMLAPNIQAFKTSWKSRRLPSGRYPYAVTNAGLSIRLNVQPWAMKIYLALLDCEICYKQEPNTWFRIGIFITRSAEANMFKRVLLHGEIFGTPCPSIDFSYCQKRLDLHLDMQTLHIQRDALSVYGFHIRDFGVIANKYSDSKQCLDTATSLIASEVVSMRPWDSQNRVLELPPGFAGTVAIICLACCGPIKTIKLGFDFDFKPVCVMSGVKFSAEEAKSKFCGKGSTYQHDVRQRSLLDIHCMEAGGWNGMMSLGDNQSWPTWRLKAQSITSWNGVIDLAYVAHPELYLDVNHQTFVYEPWIIRVGFNLIKPQRGHSYWAFSIQTERGPSTGVPTAWRLMRQGPYFCPTYYGNGPSRMVWEERSR